MYVKDIRVILIKSGRPPSQYAYTSVYAAGKQQEKTRETMDIYARIAMRLGISRLAGTNDFELEVVTYIMTLWEKKAALSKVYQKSL